MMFRSIIKTCTTNSKYLSFNLSVFPVQTRCQSSLQKCATINKISQCNKFLVLSRLSPQIKQFQRSLAYNNPAERLSSLQIKKRKRKTLDDESREIKPGV